MALSLLSSSLSFAPAAVHAPATASRAAVSMATKEELATALNPAIGYYDPLRGGITRGARAAARRRHDERLCATRPSR